MTQEATQIEVPNFEATTDGKKIFTPKQWLERFRQYTKRKYKMDIAELIRGEDMKQADWAIKKPSTKRFHMGYRPRSSIPNNKSRLHDRTGQNRNQRTNPAIQRVFLTEEKYISQPGIILLE